jgi:arylamine N-acetyltransferase
LPMCVSKLSGSRSMTFEPSTPLTSAAAAANSESEKRIVTPNEATCKGKVRERGQARRDTLSSMKTCPKAWRDFISRRPWSADAPCAAVRSRTHETNIHKLSMCGMQCSVSNDVYVVHECKDAVQTRFACQESVASSQRAREVGACATFSYTCLTIAGDKPG